MSLISRILRITKLAKYTYGSNKGGIKQGQVIADPWSIKTRTEDNTRYTGAPVVETIAPETTEFIPAWKPVDGKVEFVKAGGEVEEKALVDGKVTIVAGTYVKARYVYDNVKIPQEDLPIVNVEMANLPLVAKARRVAITRWHNSMLNYMTI